MPEPGNGGTTADVTVTVSAEVAAALPSVRILAGWRAGTEIIYSATAHAAVADVALLVRRAWDGRAELPPPEGAA